MTPQQLLRLRDTLERCSDFLDLYVDVDDGADGLPVANSAMSLKADVDRDLEILERVNL